MRYAIYYTPLPGSTLHELGSRWLGRDVFGAPVAGAVGGLEAYIKDASRYGFHATLKAPFALREGMTLEGLLAHAAGIATRLPAAVLRLLQLSVRDGFLALRPSEQGDDLADIERSLVCNLDQFRAEPGEVELARRNTAALSPRQKRHLADWGYPFVLDAFRFHLTLSRHLDEHEVSPLFEKAEKHFAPVLGRALLIDSITLFEEREPGAAFAALETFPLQKPLGVRP